MYCVLCVHTRRCMATWCTTNALVSVNQVTLRRARLVPGWVTVCRHLGMKPATGSTQPSTLCGMIKWISAFGLSRNKWRWWVEASPVAASLNGSIGSGWLAWFKGSGPPGACAVLVKWTGWTLTLAVPWWQHRKHRCGYYCNYENKIWLGRTFWIKTIRMTCRRIFRRGYSTCSWSWWACPAAPSHRTWSSGPAGCVRLGSLRPGPTAWLPGRAGSPCDARSGHGLPPGRRWTTESPCRHRAPGPSRSATRRTTSRNRGTVEPRDPRDPEADLHVTSQTPLSTRLQRRVNLATIQR